MSLLSAKLARLTSVHAERSPKGGVEARPDHLHATVSPTALRLEDRLHGPGFRQGRVPVGDARIARAATVAKLALDEALHGVDTTRMLLVDTETTGLHGGSGTLPFVIGLAWFEGESLLVRQLFVPRPGQERPFLTRLAERLHASSLLVTFNGKCFDWPLLRTRFAMNRIALPPPLPHLDLLHCARRVFKRRLGATRLQDLEAQVLDFHRRDDISGAEIPAVYFDWLRSGRPAAIERVLEHNAQDLISMAAVLAELCRRFDAPSEEDAAEDCLGLARVADRCGDSARAASFARAAVERSDDAEVSFEACALLARLGVRAKAWDEAIGWLERAAALPSDHAASAHLVLARVLEHGKKDFVRALHHAKAGAAAEGHEASDRRLARLARRAALCALTSKR